MTILSVGYDRTLLNSRNFAFQRVGHRVITATDIDDAVYQANTQPIDSAVLCYTIPETQRQRFVSAVDKIEPRIRICLLEREELSPAA